MNIVPVKIEFNTLYENRHLFTDDSHYNSLIISNLINKKIELLDFVNYNALDNIKKQHIFDENTTMYNYIVSKDILYQLIAVNCIEYYYWKKIIEVSTLTIDILTIVNEE